MTCILQKDSLQDQTPNKNVVSKMPQQIEGLQLKQWATPQPRMLPQKKQL